MPAAFNELSGEEYGDLRYARFHDLTVDAYCAQHLGEPSPQAIRSVAVHLVALYLQLERGFRPEELYAVRQRVATLAKEGKKNLPWLEPPTSLGEVTVLDVRDARNPTEHEERMLRWAYTVWRAWSPHHGTVRRWAEGL